MLEQAGFDASELARSGYVPATGLACPARKQRNQGRQGDGKAAFRQTGLRGEKIHGIADTENVDDTKFGIVTLPFLYLQN